MTLDYMTIYEECAGQPWSMYDNDPADIEDFESAMCVSINKALSHIWNLYPWSFREKKMTIRTKKGRADYNMPNGKILKRSVAKNTKYNVCLGKTYLDYVEDYEITEDDVGIPTCFYIVDNKIYLYPTPDKQYEVSVRYILSPAGLDNEDNPIYELKNTDDRVNIDVKYETYFKNCLISKAMLYAIAEESDENYSAYQKQYEEALAILIRHCKDKITERRIVW